MSDKPHSKGLGRLFTDPRLWITTGAFVLFWTYLKIVEQWQAPDYPWRILLAHTTIIITCLAMIGYAWWAGGKKHSWRALTHLFAIGFAGSIVAIWRNLEFGPMYTYGDSWFSTSMVTKYANSWGSPDFVYKDLNSFYPPLYHFIVGKAAWLTGMKSWTAMKYGCYYTAFFLPLGIFAMWRQIARDRLAFLIAVLCMFLVKEELLFKPFEMISLTLFIPWWLRFIGGIRKGDGLLGQKRKSLGKKEALWGGLIGGLLFMTFYYYFFLLLPWAILRVAMEWKENGNLKGLREKYKYLPRLFGWMALFASPFWGPLAWNILSHGLQSFQNRWWSPDMLELPFGEAGSWAILAGLIVLVWLSFRNALARSIGLLLIVQMLWLFIGHLGMYVDLPLLHVRILHIAEFGAWIALAAGFALLAEKMTEKASAKYAWLPFVVLAGLFSLQSVRYLGHDTNRSIFQYAHGGKLPALPWFEEFGELSKGKVFLTNRYDLTAYRPLYFFICHNAHFSHPSSRFRERLKFLKLLSTYDDPNFTSWMLSYNHFDAVDYVILDSNRMKVYDDNFPNAHAHIEVQLSFSENSLRGPHFVQDVQFPEIFKVEAPPIDTWKTFSRGQKMLAAVFSEKVQKEINSEIGPAVLDNFRADLRTRVRDYDEWAATMRKDYLKD